MSAATVDAERALTPEGFETVLREVLEAERQVYPARAWWPSSLGHPCDRHLVWRFTRWNDQEHVSWVLQSIFDEGKLHQPSIYRRLEQMGFDVVREQDRPVQYQVTGRGVISGRPDGRIVGFRGERLKPAPVLEAKSANGWAFDRLRTIEDVFQSSNPTIRGYGEQGNLYAFLENTPRGLLVIKSKQTGLLKPIPFELDYDRAEEALRRVERLQPLVDAQQDPPPIPYDRTVCGRCPFKGTCYPAKDYGEGTSVIDDPELIADLEERERLRPARDAYNDVDASVKDRLRLMRVTSAIAGPFVIEATFRPVRGYSVPARVDTIFEIVRRP